MTFEFQRISVIGLGYVGLPLAIALARRRHRVIGYDQDAARVKELRDNDDRTGEIDAETLCESSLTLVDDAAQMAGSDLFIVTVPTPVNESNQPDLGFVRGAAQTVGRCIRAGTVVVFESTVYPGVTEEICGPILESASGLSCGQDFFLGYSPERINPGDREHAIEKIVKVVAGQTSAVAKALADLYGGITEAGVFVARDIKTAEAAKVIENAQRDINIAFINEVTRIFHKLDISSYDVLEAAATKWNFLNFRPGLVGGHCIGIDPYYLAWRAKQVGYEPEIILAGRRINDFMGEFVAGEIAQRLNGDRVLVLGLTFKENVPDLRNSGIVDVVASLRRRGAKVTVHDPRADQSEAAALYGDALIGDLGEARGFDGIVGTVAHEDYRSFAAETFARLGAANALVADVRAMWRHIPLPEGMRRWEL